MKNLHFSNVAIKDGFWKYYTDLVRHVTARAVYDRFAETGRFDAVRCDWKDGQPNRPHIFWDSDIAKWMEGAAYLIGYQYDEDLVQKIDETVDLLAKNQREDGYFNSYYLTIEPQNTFTVRDNHELYCIGHWIEAAIAYHQATGKDKLMQCMRRSIDCIYHVFVEEQSAGFVTPGHEEIELALIKWYDYTGDEKALALARFFIDRRGYGGKDDIRPASQSHLPVREAPEAVGHAVRACYLYTAMAMMAGRDGDASLKMACDRMWHDIVNRKMSITGGIGATRVGEMFSYPYDLPNRNTYNETCAAISLAMFAGAMQELEINAAYGDIIEKVYYNGFISGVSLSGDHFFYTNPLEIDQKKNTRDGEYHPITQRVKVFSCSCCPPNVVRMLASMPRYMYTVDGNTIYCHQFADSEAKLTIGGQEALLTQKTDYPFDGKMMFTYRGAPATLKVRIPGWCVDYTGQTENGYATFAVTDGDTVTVELPMSVQVIEANPHVQDNAGRYAITRGPIVYCMEAVDNGEDLRDITLIADGDIAVKAEEGLPAPVLYMAAERRPVTEALYRIRSAERIPFTARLIPYFAFANRGETDMLVWAQVR